LYQIKDIEAKMEAQKLVVVALQNEMQKKSEMTSQCPAIETGA
jgi:hypothetical protein